MIPERLDHEATKVKVALKRLSYPEMFDVNAVVRDPDPGTLAWVEDPRTPLGEWVNDGYGLFWIKGKPGSGKSTIMKYLHQISRRRYHNHSEGAQYDDSAAFFFSNSGAPLQKSVEGLLRFLLYQILSLMPTRFVKIRQRFQLWFIEEGHEMSKEKLQYLIKELLEGASDLPSLLIFIDAIDECDSFEREDISFLKALGTMFAPKIRFCISSRPSTMLSTQLACVPQCDVAETAPTDIAIYVKSRLQAACDSDPGIFVELSSDIVKAAAGVFLWVKLVVEELSCGFEGGDTVEELRARLSKMPSELGQYFKRMLDRIDKSFRHDALVAVNVICTAIRPLSVHEFRYALLLGITAKARRLWDLGHAEWAIRTNEEVEKRLVRRYGGFAEVTNGEVRLIHYTVKEFFAPDDFATTSENPSGDRSVRIPQHQFLLRSCTRFLCLPEFKATDLGPELETPFLSYAIENWFKHYIEASADGSFDLTDIWQFFNPAQTYFQNWDRLYPRICQYIKKTVVGGLEEQTDVVCFAAQHNLLELMHGLIAAGVDVNTSKGEMGNPLQAAVVEGHLEMAQLLIKSGARVNAQGGRFGTAIAAAITLQNERMIQLLQENEAEVTLSPPLSPAPFGSKWTGYRHDFSRHQSESEKPPIFWPIPAKARPPHVIEFSSS